MSGLIGKARGWLARPVWDQALGLAHRYDKFRDARFERSRGLDLSSEVQHAELATDNADAAAQATCYQASASTLLKLAIAEAEKAGLSFDNFVDIGCGKGKICIDARRMGGFGRVIGVDFSAALVTIARENARKCGFGDEIELVCADATQYDLPDGASLVYLFNPFAERNLSRLRRLCLRRAARRIRRPRFRDDLPQPDAPDVAAARRSGFSQRRLRPRCAAPFRAIGLTGDISPT